MSYHMVRLGKVKNSLPLNSANVLLVEEGNKWFEARQSTTTKQLVYTQGLAQPSDTNKYLKPERTNKYPIWQKTDLTIRARQADGSYQIPIYSNYCQCLL